MYKQQSQGTLESPNVPLCSLFSLQLHEISKKMCSFVWRERLRSLRHHVTRPTADREFGRVCAAPPRSAYNAHGPTAPARREASALRTATLQENFMRFR